MFISFGKNKANYKKGQIFPFLIAVLCVVIIMVMITVNLGQIGIMRVDAANAADAGALAGTSVLSGALLGFGLKSDMMCGVALETALAINVAFCTIPFPASVGYAMAIWTSAMNSQLIEYTKATNDGWMAWTNAKKTSLQYTLQNVGVDEQRPSFEQFLEDAYSITEPTSASASAHYQEYLRADTWKTYDYASTGFSRFIGNEKTGYWREDEFGKVAPGEISMPDIEIGYGWEWQEETKKTYSSYPVTRAAVGKTVYSDYNNYVEAQIQGSSMYSLDMVYLHDIPLFNVMLAVPMGVVVFVETYAYFFAIFIASVLLAPFAVFLAAIIAAIATLIAVLMVEYIPAGLTMTDDEVDKPIVIRVSRQKPGRNYTLWNFRYGTVSAGARSHLARVDGSTIEPTIKDALSDSITSYILAIVCPVAILAEIAVNYKKYFDSDKHLFETKLGEVT